jgi:hypothetical protein
MIPFYRAISLGPNYGILCINGLVSAGEDAVKAKRELNEI